MTTLQELRQSYTDDSGLSMEAKYNSWFERISSFRDSVTYPAAPLNIGGVQASYNDFLNEGNKLNFDARAILSSINAFVLERNFSFPSLAAQIQNARFDGANEFELSEMSAQLEIMISELDAAKADRTYFETLIYSTGPEGEIKGLDALVLSAIEGEKTRLRREVLDNTTEYRHQNITRPPWTNSLVKTRYDSFVNDLIGDGGMLGSFDSTLYNIDHYGKDANTIDVLSSYISSIDVYREAGSTLLTDLVSLSASFIAAIQTYGSYFANAQDLVRQQLGTNLTADVFRGEVSKLLGFDDITASSNWHTELSLDYSACAEAINGVNRLISNLGNLKDRIILKIAEYSEPIPGPDPAKPIPVEHEPPAISHANFNNWIVSTNSTGIWEECLGEAGIQSSRASTVPIASIDFPVDGSLRMEQNGSVKNNFARADGKLEFSDIIDQVKFRFFQENSSGDRDILQPRIAAWFWSAATGATQEGYNNSGQVNYERDTFFTPDGHEVPYRSQIVEAADNYGNSINLLREDSNNPQYLTDWTIPNGDIDENTVFNTTPIYSNIDSKYCVFSFVIEYYYLRKIFESRNGSEFTVKIAVDIWKKDGKQSHPDRTGYLDLKIREVNSTSTPISPEIPRPSYIVSMGWSS